MVVSGGARKERERVRGVYQGKEGGEVLGLGEMRDRLRARGGLRKTGGGGGSLGMFEEAAALMAGLVVVGKRGAGDVHVSKEDAPLAP